MRNPGHSTILSSTDVGIPPLITGRDARAFRNNRYYPKWKFPMSDNFMYNFLQPPSYLLIIILPTFTPTDYTCRKILHHRQNIREFSILNWIYLK